MKSELPNVEKFQDWVCDEVLPAIRKTGTYSVPTKKATKRTAPRATKEESTVRALRAAIEGAELLGFKGNQAILSANTAVKNFRGVDCMQAWGAQGLISETQKQHWTPTALGKMIKVSAQKVNSKLESEGLQEKVPTSKGKFAWKVLPKGMAYAQVLDTGKKHSSGAPVQQTKWTDEVLVFCEEVNNVVELSRKAK